MISTYHDIADAKVSCDNFRLPGFCKLEMVLPKGKLSQVYSI